MKKNLLPLVVSVFMISLMTVSTQWMAVRNTAELPTRTASSVSVGGRHSLAVSDGVL